MSELIQSLQAVVQRTVENMGLPGMATGTVAGVNPLSVRLESKITLTEENLTATDWLTDPKDPLKPGEKVLLLRAENGQKFAVLGRMR